MTDEKAAKEMAVVPAGSGRGSSSRRNHRDRIHGEAELLSDQRNLAGALMCEHDPRLACDRRTSWEMDAIERGFAEDARWSTDRGIVR